MSDLYYPVTEQTNKYASSLYCAPIEDPLCWVSRDRPADRNSSTSNRSTPTGLDTVTCTRNSQWYVQDALIHPVMLQPAPDME